MATSHENRQLLQKELAREKPPDIRHDYRKTCVTVESVSEKLLGFGEDLAFFGWLQDVQIVRVSQD